MNDETQTAADAPEAETVQATDNAGLAGPDADGSGAADEGAKSEIHPAPVEFSEKEIEDDPVLQFFHYSHLPKKLQAQSGPFCGLARHLVSFTPRNAQRTIALNKLLEAKDAAVRAAI